MNAALRVANPFAAVARRQRYALAARMLAGKRVADLGCGDGAGSFVLAEVCGDVCGVERDGRLVAAARARAGSAAKASFVACDVLDYLGSDEAAGVDAFVACDGLAAFRDKAAGLAALERLADAGVALIVAVPGFAGTAWDTDAIAALTAQGRQTQVVHQVALAGSAIYVGGVRQTHEIRGTTPAVGRGEHHTVVLCVNVATDVSRLLESDNGTVEVLDHDPIERFWAANAALYIENRKLARAQLGKGHTAAASQIAAADRSTRQLLEETQARVLELDAEVHRVQAEAFTWERRLRELESSRVLRLAQRYWALRARLHGGSS